jgi:hypothetical protein
LNKLLLLAREERPRHRSLTVAAGASRQLEHTSTHLAPIILRTQGGISQPSDGEVSLSMEDWRHSDKRSRLLRSSDRLKDRGGRLTRNFWFNGEGRRWGDACVARVIPLEPHRFL